MSESVSVVNPHPDDAADIVERLREDARGGMAYHELSDEAADVIERLRAENEWRRTAAKAWAVIAQTNQELCDEIERLRDHMRALANTSVERDTAGIFQGMWQASEQECERLRTLLAEVDGLLACHAHVLDPAPRERWPKDSILGKAVDRHDGAVPRV